MRKIQLLAVYKKPLGDVIQDLLVDYEKDAVVHWVAANYNLSIARAILTVRQVERERRKNEQPRARV